MNFTDRILRNSLLKGVLILLSGAAIAQVISFAASILLARIYQPEDFGLLAVFTSAAGILSLIASGRYELGFMITDDNKEIKSILSLIYFLVIAFSIAISIVCLAVFAFYGALPDFNSIKTWNLILGLSVLFSTLGQVFNVYLIREKRYSILSKFRIAESTVNNGLAIAFYSLGPIGLLISYVCSQAVIFFGLQHISLKKLNPFKFQFDKKGLKETAQEHVKYPKYNILQGLIDAFQLQGVLLTGSMFLSLTAVGFYSYAMRILQVPVWLVVRPMSQVFMSESSELFRKNMSFYPLALKVLSRSFLLGIPVVTVLLVWGPDLFSLLFGEKWQGAGDLARILSFWILTDFVRAPLSQIPIILGKQGVLLKASLIGSIIILLFIILLGNSLSDEYLKFFSFLSFIQILYNCFIIYLCLNQAKQHQLLLSRS